MIHGMRVAAPQQHPHQLHRPRRPWSRRPVGLCARGCSTTATGRASSARRSESGVMPVLVERDRHHLGAERLDQVEERRESRRLEHHAVAVRDDLLEHPGDAVGRAVDDGDRLGLVGPRRGQHLAAARGAPAPPGRRARPRAGRPGAAPGPGRAAASGRACRGTGRAAARPGRRRPGRAAAATATGSGCRGRRCRTRPRDTTRPVRRSACHAADTVAGDTPSSAATSRTVGSRSPGASSPARMARLNAPAMPRGVLVLDVGEIHAQPLTTGKSEAKCSTRKITELHRPYSGRSDPSGGGP